MCGHDWSVEVSRNLLESSLNVDCVRSCTSTNQHELSHAIESVLQVVVRDDMWIAEDGSNARGLISNTILRRSSFESECLAADGLLSLPATARVVGANVVEPLRESRHFVCFIPRVMSDVVSSSRARAPHLVVRQHQKAVTIVAALLFRALLCRRSTSHAVNSSTMMHARRIGVTIAIKVGHEAALVRQSLVECARTNWNFVSKIPQEAIHSKPIVAKCAWPVQSVTTFPLRTEVPSKWNWLRPENSEGRREMRIEKLSMSPVNLRRNCESIEVLRVNQADVNEAKL